MKSKLHCFYLIALLAIVSGCNDDSETYYVIKYSSTKHMLNVGTSGGIKLKLTADDTDGGNVGFIFIDTYDTTTDWQISGMPSWLTASNIRGNHSEVVSLTASVNYNLDRRDVLLTITSSDMPGESSFMVEQKGMQLDDGNEEEARQLISGEWTWDTEWDPEERVWGSMSYALGDGDSFVNQGYGLSWGTTPEGLLDQLHRSNLGVAIGEEDRGAYMIFTKSGNVSSYDASGNIIRSGIYRIKGWEGERIYKPISGEEIAWSYGTLETSNGAILFPFRIDGDVYMPTSFEILQLDNNHLKLVYAVSGTSWGGRAT